MKKTVLIFLTLILASSLGVYAQETQTEEYAIIDAYQVGKKTVIRVTIGEEIPSEEVWKIEKTEVSEDMSPVMKELNKLNRQGYKLLNMTTTFSTPGGGASSGNMYYSYMMVRKIEQVATGE